MTGPVEGVLSHSIPPAAVRPWVALTAAVVTAAEVVPCAGYGWALWHGDEDEQAAAARACLDCPAMQACDRYATAAGERWGTWGGLTQRERAARAARAEETT